MQNRSLAFRLTAIAITVSMLTSPSMALAPTVWQFGGPGYGYRPPRPYLPMGPFPPLPLPRFFAPPPAWGYSQPMYGAYASYGYDRCCASPIRYAPPSYASDYGYSSSFSSYAPASCSGCAIGCSSCCSGYSSGAGGVVMDSCCGGVTVQPASSSTILEPEVDPDSDRKFRGLDDDSTYDSDTDPMSPDGFGRSDESGSGGIGNDEDMGNDGGRFRGFERGQDGLDGNSTAPGSRGVPRPNESGLGGDGFGSGDTGLEGDRFGTDETGLGGASPGGASDTTTPIDDTNRPGTFRRRIPETMPEFGDPSDSSGDAPMFEMGETGEGTTHSTSRPPTTPLENGENEADPTTETTTDPGGTVFLPPVTDNPAESEGAAPTSSDAGTNPESGSAAPAESTSEDDESTSDDGDASERSPEVRTSFRMTPVVLPVSRSGASSLLAPSRLATRTPSQPTRLATVKKKPDEVKTSDRHPSTKRPPIQWISLPGDESRVLR